MVEGFRVLGLRVSGLQTLNGFLWFWFVAWLRDNAPLNLRFWALGFIGFREGPMFASLHVVCLLKNHIVFLGRCAGGGGGA